MNNDYTIRRVEHPGEADELLQLFNGIFHPEKVGDFAYTLFHHFPGMKQEYWYVACDNKSGNIVSSFALLPWIWECEGVALKAGEMGIVGTHPEHRKRGLLKRLATEMSATLEEEKYDLSVIQGIPGFYHRFGYYYAVPLENHINLPLHIIKDKEEKEVFSFRLGDVKDIPFFLEQDRVYRSLYDLGCVRNELCWKYLLTKSKETEYGSDIWIMEKEKGPEKYYIRIPGQGFGEGLIVSECSEDITCEAMESVLRFCKKKALEKKLPYIRLNLHNESPLGQFARYLGVKRGTPYAWQIKIPDIPRFLKTITPVLEKRIQSSSFRNYTGTIRFDFYSFGVDCSSKGGALESVHPAKGECELVFHLPTDLVPALFLGHRSWHVFRENRPDIFPNSVKSAMLVDTLFPGIRSWIHEQY
jgi:predicted acetyltransferase